VDSSDEQRFEVEWEEEMAKVAASLGQTPVEFKTEELGAIQRWQQEKGPQDFEFLYNNHQRMIEKAGNRYMRSTQLPKAAVRSDMLRQYIKALESFNPTKGAALSTHVTTHMQHTGRYLQKYQNIGKISSTRTQHIGEFSRVMAQMSDKLGREPSTHELSDELSLSPKDVAILRKEMRKDIVAEGPGGQQVVEQSRALDRMYFTYGSLNPEQQSVMEYTEGMFGRKAHGSDAAAIGKELNISPQKVRAIKKQIWRKVERFF